MAETTARDPHTSDSEESPWHTSIDRWSPSTLVTDILSHHFLENPDITQAPPEMLATSVVQTLEGAGIEFSGKPQLKADVKGKP